MTLSELWMILMARWRSMLVVMGSVIALVMGASLLLKEQYTATAAVVLDVKSPDPIAGIVLPGMTTSGYMATQMGVLTSERVALRAIGKLGMDQDEALKANWREATEGRGSFESWLAGAVLKKLDVAPGRDSNVMSISYTSPDAALSADMTNAFVKAFIDITAELRNEPARQFNAFFDARSKSIREELEHAQAKLSDYQRSKGIIATDEKLDVENSRLMELSSQLVALQAVAESSRSRQGQAVGNAERMPEVLASPIVIGLTSDLSRQQARLDELSERLGDRHPQVRELKSTVAQLRSRIATETRRVAASLQVDNSVNQARLVELRASLDAQRAKILQMKSQRDEAAVLLRDLENAQRAYDMVLQRSNQSSLESQATQTNVSVLQEASLPTRPSSPKLVLNFAVSLMLGVLLGAAAAVVREFGDRRLRTDEDVLTVLKQPLIGVLPRRALPRSPGGARWRLRLGQSALALTGSHR